MDIDAGVTTVVPADQARPRGLRLLTMSDARVRAAEVCSGRRRRPPEAVGVIRAVRCPAGSVRACPRDGVRALHLGRARDLGKQARVTRARSFGYRARPGAGDRKRSGPRRPHESSQGGAHAADGGVRLGVGLRGDRAPDRVIHVRSAHCNASCEFSHLYERRNSQP
jgi:hypothetical protein